MRNRATEDEIRAVINILHRAWLANPEQRLGQLMMNVISRDPSTLWNAEEAEIIEKLKGWLNGVR